MLPPERSHMPQEVTRDRDTLSAHLLHGAVEIDGVPLHARCGDQAQATGIEVNYVMSYPDWVHVVRTTKSHCLLLVRQYRHAAGECFLELPVGVVESDDISIEDAAQRELENDTGRTSAQVSAASPRLWRPKAVARPRFFPSTF